MLNIVIDNPKIEKFLNYSPDEAKKNLEIFCEKQIEKKTTETVKKYHELNDFLAKKKNTLKICERVDIYEIIREVNAQ